MNFGHVMFAYGIKSLLLVKKEKNKTGVINDPLGQTHSLASSEHCFHLKFVLFC